MPLAQQQPSQKVPLSNTERSGAFWTAYAFVWKTVCFARESFAGGLGLITGALRNAHQLIGGDR
jgi:hypothetical protein